ncbi:MAG: M48 family metallopeptidase [Bacteriovoracaceae bacterium]
MHYLIFLAIPIIYNFRKFQKERSTLITSLKEIKNSSHYEMVLNHHFTTFFTEMIFSFTVALFINEQDRNLFFIYCMYGAIAILSYFIFGLFIKYLEKQTDLNLFIPFKNKLFKDMRVNGAIVLLPFILFQFLYFSLSGDLFSEWGSWWFFGLFANLIFISIVTVICTVILLLKLIPNREITEPDFLEIIQKRLDQAGQSKLRLRWIEADFKNAFVIGVKLLSFTNETMFVGRTLRERFTLEEFDAVICHEIAHIVNRHYQKRVMFTLKSYFILTLFLLFIFPIIFFISWLSLREQTLMYIDSIVLLNVGFFILATFFVIFLTYRFSRSQEYEADAFAVMKLGVSFEALKSALEKLSNTDIPDYLKGKKLNQKQSYSSKWFGTHPQVSDRLKLLEEKMVRNLSFDYRPSVVKKIYNMLFSWKILIPNGVLALAFAFYLANDYQLNQKLLIEVQTSSAEDLLKNKELEARINSYPSILGPNFMAYIIVKNDAHLIDHYLSMGADKWTTLYYLEKYKKTELFKKYFPKFENELTRNEYFNLLKMSAQIESVETYQFLLSSVRAKELDNHQKSAIAKSFNDGQKRAPAAKE